MLSSILVSHISTSFIHPSVSRAIDTCDGDNCRTLLNIIWGCLATIFASSWVSVHPNLPAPGERWFKHTLRKLGMVFIAIIAPELMVYFAARQLAVALKFSNTDGWFSKGDQYRASGLRISRYKLHGHMLVTSNATGTLPDSALLVDTDRTWENCKATRLQGDLLARVLEATRPNQA
ncbi:hypothetical protein C8R44DRAFT_730402 [Mycena epipterygia]|nr:hypothetical protein C8R44DRAFT_730402 [Mycena epipterygia]